MNLIVKIALACTTILGISISMPAGAKQDVQEKSRLSGNEGWRKKYLITPSPFLIYLNEQRISLIR